VNDLLFRLTSFAIQTGRYRLRHNNYARNNNANDRDANAERHVLASIPLPLK
jgi:hypothetical protein